MITNDRTACRQRARELGIKKLATDALKVPSGHSWSISDGSLYVIRAGASVRVKEDGTTVFHQVGKDIKVFHEGSWIEDLRELAGRQAEAANFSCKDC